jgi:tetratricopeptide (TPR) repeat protein
VRQKAFLLGITVVFAVVLGVYLNHFQNSFHFDDFHTITQNPYVHDLHNLPRFFSDAHTFSIMPDHGSYRPVVTTSLAIDYWLSKGASPFWFHVSTFFWYLIQLALMFLLFAHLMDAANPHPDNRWFALFAVALYGLHPVSAETVNYIIQRAEIYSSIGVIGGLVIYIKSPGLRRIGLYLVPVVLGILSKPPAAVFAGILFLYILLFEVDRNLEQAAKRSIPAAVVCLCAGALVLHMEAGTFSPGGASPGMYRLIQPYVTWHYFSSFFWPSSLTADSDIPLAGGWADRRVALGFLFVASLCIVAWLTTRRRELRPIAFGIGWFLLALLPVAWVPLSEVENDHRMFFPFVGLTLAVVWAMRQVAGEDLRSLAVAATVVLAVCGYGTRQRNEIWRSEETLWRDVASQSPRNGRGLMNYGLTLMSKGDINGAITTFEKALLLTPNYSFLHINLGVANGALGRDAEAEQHFTRALALAPNDSQSYSYYARWISQRGRVAEAIALLEVGAQKNPADLQCRTLLLQLYSVQGDRQKFERLLADSLRLAPNDPDVLRFAAMQSGARAQVQPTGSVAQPTPEGLLSLSLSYYQAHRYQECIAAAQEALRLRPNYAEAYNNISAASNALGRYEDGIQAAAEAIRLKPDFMLAQNNLAWAQSQLQRTRKR